MHEKIKRMNMSPMNEYSSVNIDGIFKSDTDDIHHKKNPNRTTKLGLKKKGTSLDSPVKRGHTHAPPCFDYSYTIFHELFIVSCSHAQELYNV